MNWRDFHAAVCSFLGAHAEDKNPIRQRQITQAIRSGCLRLQQVIEAYQTGHETTFTPDDLTADCYAHRGDFPDGASIQSLWLYRPEESEEGSEPDACETERIELRRVDWANRNDMITGVLRDCNIWTADPNGNRFYIAPTLQDGEELRVVWNGLKIDFGETDTLPWGEEAVEVVSHFVNAQIDRLARDKISNYASYMRDWQQGVALLDARESARRNGLA